MIEFELNGLEELQEKLKMVQKNYVDQTDKILRKSGRELKRICKEKTPYREKDKNHIRDKYKITQPKFNGTYSQIELTNTAPHFHLVERGHVIKNRKHGKNFGYVPGKHMVERGCNEFEEEYPKMLDEMLDKVLKKLE